MISRLLAAGTVLLASLQSAGAGVVRFTFTGDGESLGVVDVRLYETIMPTSTANFLHYVQTDKWDGSFIHRSVPGFVVQGGGFFVPDNGIFSPVDSVDTIAPIADEPLAGQPRISNRRGTIAYAKSGPNTATSQWFFNLGNNSGLDSPTRPDGGFAAFGRVLGNGMSVIDSIAALARFNFGFPPYEEVPALDADVVFDQQNFYQSDAVVVQDVSLLAIPDGDYDLNGQVNLADLNKWKATLGSTTDAFADGNGNGVVDGADFLVWQRSMAATATVSHVPEPGAVALALIFCLAAGLTRNRRRMRPWVMQLAYFPWRQPNV